jgi:plasmid stabilization system protein ParE
LVVFLSDDEPDAALATYDLVLGAFEVLRTYPSIGRPVDDVLRELVISRGRSGYLALYEYDVPADRVVVLALRHQREAGYVERGATDDVYTAIAPTRDIRDLKGVIPKPAKRVSVEDMDRTIRRRSVTSGA